MYNEIKPGLSAGNFRVDGKFTEWTSVESSFSSGLDLKLAVSKENLFISGKLNDQGQIKSVSVELGRLSFSSENEVSIESVEVLDYEQESSNLIQNGNMFELQVEKDSFSRVGHSAIWYSSLKIKLSNGIFKILPIFKPSIDFNRNSDFEIHKCHLENSRALKIFDIINESNLELDSFNPILQNAVSLSFFDHMSKFSFSIYECVWSLSDSYYKDKVVKYR